MIIDSHQTTHATAVQNTYKGTAVDYRLFWRRGTDFGWIVDTDDLAEKSTQSQHAVVTVRLFAVDLIECRRNTHLDDFHIVHGGMFSLDSLVDDACVDQGQVFFIDFGTGGAEALLRGGKAEDGHDANGKELHVGGDGCLFVKYCLSDIVCSKSRK